MGGVGVGVGAVKQGSIVEICCDYGAAPSHGYYPANPQKQRLSWHPATISDNSLSAPSQLPLRDRVSKKIYIYKKNSKKRGLNTQYITEHIVFYNKQ